VKAKPKSLTVNVSRRKQSDRTKIPRSSVLLICQPMWVLFSTNDRY